MPFLAYKDGNILSHVPTEDIYTLMIWLAKWLSLPETEGITVSGLKVIGVCNKETGRVNYKDPRIKGITIVKVAPSEEYRYAACEDGRAVTKVCRDWVSCVHALLTYLELDSHDYGVDFSFRPDTQRIMDIRGIHNYREQIVEWIKPGFTIVSF